MATLSGIAVKLRKGADLHIVRSIFVSASHGLEGDVRGGGGRDRRRQVTLLSYEQWSETCEGLGKNIASLPWQSRRANLLIRDVRFAREDIGKQMRIGEKLVLEITGETEPCERMNEVLPGLKDALSRDMRAGVTCRVLTEGHIWTGDTAILGHWLSL